MLLRKLIPSLIRRSYSVQQDFLSLEKFDLIWELSHMPFVQSSTKDTESVEPWVRSFMMTSRILESYLLLQSRQTSKDTLRLFKNIDPDSENVLPKEEKAEKEKLFLENFSNILKKAGYEEVSQQIIQSRLKRRHKYGDIELRVPHKQYQYVRIWTKGRKDLEFQKKRYPQHMFVDSDFKGILHERVLLVAKHRVTDDVVLKGFKNLPVNHFEVLVPEAKLYKSGRQRWYISISFVAAALYSVATDGLDIATEFGLSLRNIILVFLAIGYYRSSNNYEKQKTDCILEWKEILYHKSTANNSGLVLEVVNGAQDRTLKEALLVYGIALQLTATETHVTKAAIIRSACGLLSKTYQAEVKSDDVDFCSAFSLLGYLGLISLNNKKIKVVKPESANLYLNQNLKKLLSAKTYHRLP